MWDFTCHMCGREFTMKCQIKKMQKKYTFHSQGYQDSSYLLKIQKCIRVSCASVIAHKDTPKLKLWWKSKTEILTKLEYK